MNADNDPAMEPPHRDGAAGSSTLMAVLSVILFAEAALVVGVAGWLAWELVTEKPSSFATAVALLVLVAIAGVWVVAVAVGSLRRLPWVRGGAVTWQVLQFAVAIGAFQGLFARPDVGWALLAPAVVAFVLLLTPTVRDAFARPVTAESTGRGDASDGADG